MVFLNGKPFPVYPLDTQETRLNRVAARLGTLPYLVSTTPEDIIDIDSKTNIDAVDLLDLIRTDATNSNYDFASFYDEIKESFPHIPKDKILYTWLTSIEEDDNLEATLQSIEMVIDEDLTKILGDKSLDLRLGLDRFLEEQKKLEAGREHFHNIVPVQIDNFHIKDIEFDIEFKTDADIPELFEQIKLSQEIPYANNGSELHKIYKGFRHVEEGWVFGDQNKVLFCFLNVIAPPTKYNRSHYSQGLLTLKDDDVAVLSLQTPVDAKGDVNALTDRVFRSLGIKKDSVIGDRIERSVNCSFNIPEQRFSRLIMCDIISNDPFISDICSLHELETVYRQKSEIYMYYQDGDKAIAISLLEKTAENSDIRRNIDLYPPASRYTRVVLKGVPNEGKAREIANFVGKLFRTYNQNKDKILKEYQEIIPEFTGVDEKKPNPVEQKKMKASVIRGRKKGPKQQKTNIFDIEPGMFVTDYARACQHAPVIVDDFVPKKSSGHLVHNIEGPTRLFKEAILFPRTKEEGPQHWYACNDDYYEYPGLKEMKSVKGCKYPVLPCCFLKSQENTGLTAEYYGRQVSKKTKKTFAYVLKTFKFLDVGEIGVLPDNINLLLQAIYGSSDTYYRTGSERNHHSFLSAVSIALKKKVDKSKISLEMLSVCRQNDYTSSAEDLKRILNDPTSYVSPSIFYRAVEELCGCYIYLFTQTNGVGALLHPPHKHVMWRFKREKRPVVLIIEHMGAESDGAHYPQCEAIVLGKKKEANFDERIDAAFRGTLSYYLGDKIVKDIPKDPILDNVEGQYIDSFGKTRIITVKHKGKNIEIITDPLPPLVGKEKKEYSSNNEDLVIDFIADKEMEILEKTAEHYIAKRGNFTFTFLIKKESESLLELYNHNQRTARYLQEYAYFLFCKYSTSKGELLLPREKINSFLREMTVVKPNYKYPKIGRKFDLKGPYIENGKLIVPSLECAQRLGFGIEMLMRRRPEILSSYHNNKYILEFYIDKNDFVSDPDSLVFMSRDSLWDWINEHKIEYTLRTFPTRKEKLYYLKIRDKVRLIHVGSSLENAIYISNTWKKEGYNPQTVVRDDSECSYVIFESPLEIREMGTSPTKILVWREADTLYFGAILD